MNALPSTAEALISALTRSLREEGFNVAPAPPAATLEEATLGLFLLAGRARASFFSVWADRLEDGTLSAGLTLLFLPTVAPGRKGMQEPRRVRQHFDPALHGPLVQALATVARRGQEPRRPSRGQVALPPGDEEPDLLFLVDFQDGEFGTEVSALARDRKAQALFRPFSALPLSPEEATLLEETFFAPRMLLEGHMVLFTGRADPLRTAAWRAALAAPPRSLNILVALENPLPLDPRVGAVLLGDDLPLGRVISAFSRQDPDLIFAETARTREELRMLAHISSKGRGVAALLDVETPEAAVRMLNEAAGAPCQPLIVHCSRGPEEGVAELSVYAVSYPSGAEPQVVRWTP